MRRRRLIIIIIILLPVQSGPCASPPTSVSCNYVPPLLPASPASAGPARVICVRIGQIKKYNVRESAIRRGYWTQKRGAESHSLLVGLLFAVGNHIPKPSASPQPLLPPKWKTGAVMTICNINLIGLTVSPGFPPPPFPRYLWLYANPIALIAYSRNKKKRKTKSARPIARSSPSLPPPVTHNF